MLEVGGSKAPRLASLNHSPVNDVWADTCGGSTDPRTPKGCSRSGQGHPPVLDIPSSVKKRLVQPDPQP